MTKGQITGFILIVLTVIVLLLTLLAKDKVDVSLIVMTLKNVHAAFVYLGFTVVGVLIGILLK